MNSRLFLAVIGLALVFSAAAHADPIRLHCSLKRSPHGWIAQQMFIEVGPAGTARVLDPIILHFEEKPVAAEVTEDTARKLAVTWSVRTRNSRGQFAKMSYRAAFLKQNGKLLVSAKPHGYGNDFIGRGKCLPTSHPFPTG